MTIGTAWWCETGGRSHLHTWTLAAERRPSSPQGALTAGAMRPQAASLCADGGSQSPATGRDLSALTTPSLCQSVATAPTAARTTTGRLPNAPSAPGAILLAGTVHAIESCVVCVAPACAVSARNISQIPNSGSRSTRSPAGCCAGSGADAPPDAGRAGALFGAPAHYQPSSIAYHMPSPPCVAGRALPRQCRTGRARPRHSRCRPRLSASW